MLKEQIKIKITEAGYTMTELVVTIAMVGTLLSFAVPRYTSVSEETQGERNIANMQVIRETFFHYFYRMHQKAGRIAHFPPQPTNTDTLMTETWANTPMTLSGDKPKDLFSSGKLPMNSNNKPFKYKTWKETDQTTGEVNHYITIEDVDEDSPSYGKSFTYSRYNIRY